MTKLDEKLWIFAYKMASKSAKALSEELDVYLIRHEDSIFKGNKDRFILNWGAGTGVFNARVNGAKVFNDPERVDLAVNKLTFFNHMVGKDAPRIPKWTISKNRALGWLDTGCEMIARTVLEGANGEGLILVKTPEDLPKWSSARLFTIKVPSTAEFRVYMFNGRVLDFRVKKLARGKEDTDRIRIEDNGWLFCKTNEIPGDVAVQSVLAINKIGLFTGGIDVVYDETTGRATVLEINTAPYLGGDTVKLYGRAFREYIG